MAASTAASARRRKQDTILVHGARIASPKKR